MARFTADPSDKLEQKKKKIEGKRKRRHADGRVKTCDGVLYLPRDIPIVTDAGKPADVWVASVSSERPQSSWQPPATYNARTSYGRILLLQRTRSIARLLLSFQS